MDYKKILILTYLNTMKSSYSYIELSEVFGLTTQQIYSILETLENDNYIILDKYYKLTDKSKELLKKYNLEDVDFFSNFDESQGIFGSKKMDINEVYVPIGFMKKIK